MSLLQAMPLMMRDMLMCPTRWRGGNACARSD
jgi:hypothetical protein